MFNKKLNEKILILEETINRMRRRELAKKLLKIQLFKDKKKQWRFRLRAPNGNILCSSEAYSKKCSASKTAELIQGAKFVVVEE